MTSVMDAVRQRCVRDPRTGCLVWMDEARNGYAHSPELGRVYRAVYIDVVGPIPLGWHVDHVYRRGCRYRACVEPTHLEAVTQGENFRRGLDAGRSGHRSWDPELIRPPDMPRAAVPSRPEMPWPSWVPRVRADLDPPPPVVGPCVRPSKRRDDDLVGDRLAKQLRAWARHQKSRA